MLQLSALASGFFTGAILFIVGLTSAQSELDRLCEVKPAMKCLDKARIEGITLKVPSDAVAIQRDGLLICDSSFNYTTAPDVILIMDNTRSMAKDTVIDGIPRWCKNPALEASDPGCISGDPDHLRGPALKTFLDRALVKGGKGMNVGVVLFSQFAEAKSDKLLPLSAATIDTIKSSITMEEDGQTNYTAAFRTAFDLLKSSRKPNSEQFIIFVSDGRPNLPKPSDGGPYLYKEFWDSLPVVHSIFLGANAANFQDMQDISDKTKGFFFNITDVSKLAGILTGDIAKTLFRRATPTYSTVSNLTSQTHFQLAADKHFPAADSGVYVLQMPWPLQLNMGINDLVVKTEYGFGGAVQDVHFKIERTPSGPYDAFDKFCPASLAPISGGSLRIGNRWFRLPPGAAASRRRLEVVGLDAVGRIKSLKSAWIGSETALILPVISPSFPFFQVRIDGVGLEAGK